MPFGLSLQAAYDYVFQIIAEEGIDAALQRCGRFIPVFSERQYDKLAREMELRNRYLADPFAMVPRAEQHRYLGTDSYHGGVWGPERGAFHPGHYHLGLLARCRAAGSSVTGTRPPRSTAARSRPAGSTGAGPGSCRWPCA